MVLDLVLCMHDELSFAQTIEKWYHFPVQTAGNANGLKRSLPRRLIHAIVDFACRVENCAIRDDREEMRMAMAMAMAMAGLSVQHT